MANTVGNRDWRSYEEKTRDTARDALAEMLLGLIIAGRVADPAAVISDLAEKLDDYVVAAIEKVQADDRRRELERD